MRRASFWRRGCAVDAECPNLATTWGDGAASLLKPGMRLVIRTSLTSAIQQDHTLMR
jgi:hypothetical protein